jgi:kynureninase
MLHRVSHGHVSGNPWLRGVLVRVLLCRIAHTQGEGDLHVVNETFVTGSRACLARIADLDRADPFAVMRDKFVLPQGVIYLDGNSLGPAPKAALAELHTAAHEEWAQGLIRSWNAAGWWTLAGTLGDKIGRLIGADAGETIVCDTTSSNIYKALHAGLAMRPGRKAILTEASSFPTDIYIAEGIARIVPGVEVRLSKDTGADFAKQLNQDVAVVLANQVDYRTGALRDVHAVTAQVHAAGAVIIWDLCHSAGAMPVDLNAAQADLAVGCSYKYLNGGPGAPAFVYVARRHHEALTQPLSGWWGHAAPFAFEPGYRPDLGVRRMLCGTQPILSMRTMKAAIDLWDDVVIADVRAKSVALTRLFIDLVETSCAGHGLSLASPRDDATRGSQVSFAHPHGYPIMQNLIARGVIGDFRAPNLIRFGFAPLYVSYRDVHDAAAILRDILVTGSWKDAAYAARSAVT